MSDIWRPIDGSWAHHDLVRHVMYERIFATLKRTMMLADPLRVMEIGAREPTTSIIRMLKSLHGQRVEAQVCDYPQIDIQILPNEWTGHWDVLIVDQVLEHVQNIFAAALEIYKVLKPGGLAIVATPYLHPTHPAPLDCWRISPDGYRFLFPELWWETVEFGSWGNRAIIQELYASKISRGMTGEWIPVRLAQQEVPSWNTPPDGLHPVVIWWLGIKK